MAREPTTLDEIKASRPRLDRARVLATTDADIRRHQIEDGEDPAAPLPPFRLVANGPAIGAPVGNKHKAVVPNGEDLVSILRDTVVALVRRDGPDLSARQLGVFLTCYLRDEVHTIRGLAAELNVSRPAITRALDRLGELDVARRKVDPMDRRSALVQRTLRGTAFLRDLRAIMTDAVAAGTKPASGSRSRRAAA